MDQPLLNAVKQKCESGTLVLNSFIDKEQSYAINSKQTIHSTIVKIVVIRRKFVEALTDRKQAEELKIEILNQESIEPS